jgi:cytidine deaminase
MEKVWNELVLSARKRIDTQKIDPFIEYGHIACSILTNQNHIYTAINIKSNTEINSSAEKNAISMMLNNGEKIIKKMVIVNELEEIIKPSEECFDYLLELGEEFGDIEVLMDEKKGTIKQLKDILPDWWGTYRIKVSDVKR